MRIPLSAADLAARALTIFSPEQAHQLTIQFLSAGVAPVASLNPDPCLAQSVAGLSFSNPLGLAAGFDKNAQVPNAMVGLGFGFVEVGAVTPRPQPGNPRPRVFRLREDMAVINRYGFNNDGLDVIRQRLAARKRCGIVGINLGANKETDDRIEDYVTSLTALAGLVDFYTVNISSPNTPGLRALQDKSALMTLLSKVLEARDAMVERHPVFLKIAPDLTDTDKTDIADTVRAMGIDGLIIANTTIERPDDLQSRYAEEVGGLSGAPLFERSTRLLGEFYQVLGGDVPLIGVGGVTSARDAYRKILAGASLVQLYTALIYHGPGLISKILRALPGFLQADGFSSVRAAVGAQFR